MKNEYKIFFAIPFDNLTKKIYDEICSELVNYFNEQGCKLTAVIGNKQIGPSQDYLDILSFRAQNTELQKQFFKEIEEADIILADLTNNNPNVHLELGIALVLNKNILRVTGRPVKELGFDIQSLEVYTYRDKNDLSAKIKEYLKTFLSIKRLEFSDKYRALYKKIDQCVLPGTKAEIKENVFFFSTVSDYSFRDGAIQLKFRFLDNLNPESWLGVYFRAAREFLYSSYLLYVRKNGSVELALYPGPNVIDKRKLFKTEILDREIELILEIENNELVVKINGQGFQFLSLEKQNIGNIILATWECRAHFRDIELIDRDTG